METQKLVYSPVKGKVIDEDHVKGEYREKYGIIKE